MSGALELVAALRVIRGGRGFASRDPDLMRRVRALYEIVLGGSEDTDEAIIIRALAQLSDVQQASLAAAARTHRRRTDALAAEARRLNEEGHRTPYIAAKLGRSTDTVRRWRRERP
jgi:hypothetical protein